MKIIGIDIGTTTISGVVLENKVEGQITTKAEEKLEIVEAKTIENGCFIPTEHEWICSDLTAEAAVRLQTDGKTRQISGRCQKCGICLKSGKGERKKLCLLE